MSTIRMSASARRRRRGYSLVEIMIVLVASALLASGPILLMYNKMLDDNYASARRQLEIVKGRIIDYAAANRTASRQVDTLSANSPQPASPEGRPHLPCPDIDGDGIEDRHNGGVNRIRSVGEVIFSRGFRGHGCVQTFGLLPYVTLGTQSKDPFGNRLVYFVDRGMASAVLGFDARTKAGSYDESSSVQSVEDATGERHFRFPNRTVPIGVRPNVLCLGHPDPTAAAPDQTCRYGDLQGSIATTDITVDVQRDRHTVRVVYDSTDNLEDRVIEGLAFGVISPGRFWQGHLYLEGECLGADPLVTTTAETGDAFNYLRLSAALCGSGPLGPRTPLAYATREPAAYGGGNTAGAGPGRFGDDQAIWMTAGELSGEMQRLGVYPVKPLPLVGLYAEDYGNDWELSRRGLRPTLVRLADSLPAVVARFTEELQLGLLGGLIVTLEPGAYELSLDPVTPLTERGTATAWDFSCSADLLRPVSCEILPVGGVNENEMNLVMTAFASLDVTIPLGLQVVQVVTAQRPVEDNLGILPWQ